jgi:NAD(P)-dependent dehydrogenase (short-subunit alcohol dehydrogenase family)
VTDVVVVTGAASGIGRATAARFRRDGHTVIGLDRVAVDDVVECDVTDATVVSATFAAIGQEHERIDVLANVAGVPQMGRIEDITGEEWQRVLDVNLTAPFRVTQAALPWLRVAKGCVINVASIAGLEGQAYTAAYCASKGGLVLLTKALAVELAPDGIRVSCVCPGGVNTPLVSAIAEQIPADADGRLLGRLNGLLPGFIEPEEIAEAIAYLASDAARMISGTALVIDGARQS